MQPLLVVFEDLHWIDAETQALLDSLVESLPTARLLLLVNYRPEYQHGWGSKTYYSQLRLDPLPAESAAELLERLLGGDPALAPLKRAAGRSAGNPFFLEESIRTLVETGALAGERGAYRLTRPVEAIAGPGDGAGDPGGPDRPAPGGGQAAAPGRRRSSARTCPFALLQARSRSRRRTRCGGALAHLQAAEFLYETRLFPDLEYTFKHALTHEVAYGSLLQDRRTPCTPGSWSHRALLSRPADRARRTAGPPCRSG